MREEECRRCNNRYQIVTFLSEPKLNVCQRYTMRQNGIKKLQFSAPRIAIEIAITGWSIRIPRPGIPFPKRGRARQEFGISWRAAALILSLSENGEQNADNRI
jgi:hypothetical protein